MWHFLWFFWVRPLPPFKWHPQFSVKLKGLKIVHILTSRNCHFRLFLGGFLTSDDMQHDASNSIWFLLKYQEIVKIGPEISLAHFVRFFVYALLHLMSYAPKFCRMKDLMKIYICGKFHQYSICGCGAKRILDWVSIHEMAPFYGVWGPYFLKYCSILLKCWREVVFNKPNSVFKKSFKILNFSLNEKHPKFTV